MSEMVGTTGLEPATSTVSSYGRTENKELSGNRWTHEMHVGNTGKRLVAPELAPCFGCREATATRYN
jgi:hypothetical protein